MKAKRRFTEHKAAGKPMVLADNHRAVYNHESLFHGRVAEPHVEERLFKSGVNSRKIGSHVTKGKWKGMPIYTLTLEERATCPRVCEHWHDCFGNKMHWSTRWNRGELLEKNIPIHIAALAKKHPLGFAVRLHVLGDFYSPNYVRIWTELLITTKQLHIFGFTRTRRGSSIGDLIAHMHVLPSTKGRCSIRWSECEGTMGTKTLTDVTLRGKVPEGIVCPAQTGDADCCGTCALCWSTTQPIVFLNH